MKIIDTGILPGGCEDSNLSSQTFPSLCELECGRMLFSFKGSPKKGPFNTGECGYTSISDNGGKTFSKPITKFNPLVVDGKPITIRTLYYLGLGGGKVLAVLNAVAGDMNLEFFNEKTKGLKDTYIMYALSGDNAETFSELKRLYVASFPDTPLPLTGAPIMLKNGSIALQFEVNKKYYDENPWTHNSVVVYSHDGGKTWGDEVIVTNHPHMYYWDQRISCLDDGRILDLFWSFDRSKGDYVNIHACESLDNGKSYSDVFDTGLSGQPGNALSLPDGRICCIYINRDASPIINLAVSEDGRNWEDELTVYDSDMIKCTKDGLSMNDAWSEMGAFCVGHPFITGLSDGTILAYYYAGKTTHRTDIHFKRIQP